MANKSADKSSDVVIGHHPYLAHLNVLSSSVCSSVSLRRDLDHDYVFMSGNLTNKFVVPIRVDLSPFVIGYNQRLDKLSDRCYVNFRAFIDIKEEFKEMADRMKELLEKKTQECADMELDLQAQLEKKQKELIMKEGTIIKTLASQSFV